MEYIGACSSLYPLVGSRLRNMHCASATIAATSQSNKIKAHIGTYRYTLKSIFGRSRSWFLDVRHQFCAVRYCESQGEARAPTIREWGESAERVRPATFSYLIGGFSVAVAVRCAVILRILLLLLAMPQRGRCFRVGKALAAFPLGRAGPTTMKKKHLRLDVVR
jgi:hypothetical protein